jgi:hypothetical protein
VFEYYSIAQRRHLLVSSGTSGLIPRLLRQFTMFDLSELNLIAQSIVGEGQS